jgi:hypothetical protein
MIENKLTKNQKIKYFDLATRFQIDSSIAIENKGDNTSQNSNTWVITYIKRYCYNNSSSEWVVDRIPSNRTAAFIAQTRFTLEKAFEIVNSEKFQKEFK